jgi:hypothetical protein
VTGFENIAGRWGGFSELSDVARDAEALMQLRGKGVEEGPALPKTCYAQDCFNGEAPTGFDEQVR